MRRRSLIAFSLATLPFVIVVQAASIVNGSFETGTVDPETATVNGPFITLDPGSIAITGWTVFKSGVDSTGSLWPAPEGTRSVDLNGFHAGGIQQTLATMPGRQYRVSFMLAGNPYGGPSLKVLRVSAAGQSQDYTFNITGHSTASLAAMGWTLQTFTFTASAATTVVAFESLTTTGGPCTQQAVLEDGTVVSRSGPACWGPMVDDVSIRVGPTANAGADQSIHVGQLVTLDGGASFDDNTATEQLIFTWTLTGAPEGSSAALASANTATPSFIADLPGEYTARLVVTDEDGLSSAPDKVAVSSLNAAPVANAGADQGTFVGNPVVLDGSASSDADHDALEFSWTLAAPAGSVAMLAGETTVSPTLTPDVAGTYTATLTVTDPFGGISTDSVDVTVITGARFAENQTSSALNVVGALTPAQVTSQGNQRALQRLFIEVIAALQAGDVEEARDTLTQALARIDGCVLRGSPDGNGAGRDWVTDCAAQATLYQLLTEALDALTP